MKRSLVVLAFLFVCALPAAAQTTANPSQARIRAAEELVDVMDMEKNLKETTDALLAQQKEQNPVLAQFDDIMRDFMEKALDWDELRDDYVRMYAQIYNEQELRQLRQFYQTPLGQRLLATLPEVAARSSEISNERLQQFLPEMQRRIMERMMENENQP